MRKLEFTRVAKFKFDGNYYQMFQAEKNKVAFLKVNSKGQYLFPTIKEFTNLVRFFVEDKEKNAYYEDNSHKKYRFTPLVKEVVKGRVKTVMITSLLVAACLTGCKSSVEPSSYYYDIPNIEISSEYSGNYSYDDTEPTNTRYSNGFYETEDFELLESSKKIDLYNNKYFKDIFKVDNHYLSEVFETLNSNKNIPDEFKPYFEETIKAIDDYYGDIDYRVLNHNLKTLEFEKKATDDYDFIMSGGDAYYDFENNKMVVKEDIDLKNNQKSRVIFRHEIGHIYNHLRLNCDGYDIKYGFNDAGRGKYLKECLNVIFTTEPFLDDYDSKQKENLGYPITTNIVRILLASMDYKVEDSLTNNVYYFQNKLDEVAKNDIEASVIEELLELQWMEYSSDMIEIDTAEYKDLYSYVARRYIAKNLSTDMSYDEINDYYHDLEEKLQKGVKNPDYVYMEAVKKEFDNYMEENNIKANNRTR